MITRTVFNEILSSLSVPDLTEYEAEVNPAALKTKANNMIARGYEFSAESLEALRLYMSGYSLFLHGGVGTGKTMFFKLLRDHKGKPIHIFPVYSIFGRSESEIAEIVSSLTNREIVIDDLGSEPLYNNYGVKFDILTYIITRRLDSPCRTHITTNLSKTDIAKRYGARIIDRLAEMCRAVELKGKSKRYPKPNRAVVRALESYNIAKSAANAATGGVQDKTRPSIPPRTENGTEAVICPF